MKNFKILIHSIAISFVGYLLVITGAYVVGILVSLVWTKLGFDPESSWLAVPVLLILYPATLRVGDWMGSKLSEDLTK